MANRSLSRRIAVALAAMVLATPAGAVENGRPDRAHRAVGALGFDVDGAGPLPPFALCSGFVISDRAFVTAAHCITAVDGFAASWAVTLEAGAPEDPIHPPGVFDLAGFNVFDFPILSETFATTTVHLHPGRGPVVPGPVRGVTTVGRVLAGRVGRVSVAAGSRPACSRFGPGAGPKTDAFLEGGPFGPPYARDLTPPARRSPPGRSGPAAAPGRARRRRSAAAPGRRVRGRR